MIDLLMMRGSVPLVEWSVGGWMDAVWAVRSGEDKDSYKGCDATLQARFTTSSSNTYNLY